MTRHFTAALCLSLSCAFLPAQQQEISTTKKGTEIVIERPQKGGPQKGTPVEVKPLQPRGTGVIYYIDKDGLVIISPSAPPRYGYGKEFLTAAPFSRATNPSVSSDDEQNLDREYGGIKLLGWEW